MTNTIERIAARSARHFQKSLAQYSGVSVAADLLKNAFGLTKVSDSGGSYPGPRLPRVYSACADSSIVDSVIQN